MKNSPNPNSDLQKVNVIYQYKCQKGDCELLPNSQYIGMTTTTLSRRLTMHLQSGSIKTHTLEKHNLNITRDDLISNTTIYKQINDLSRLKIIEALRINNLNPSLNQQNSSL